MKIHQKYIFWGTFGVTIVKISENFLKNCKIGVWSQKSPKNIQKWSFSQKFAPKMGVVGGSTEVGDIEKWQKSIFAYLNYHSIQYWANRIIFWRVMMILHPDGAKLQFAKILPPGGHSGLFPILTRSYLFLADFDFWAIVNMLPVDLQTNHLCNQ